jgi:hypothetical protein
VELAELLLAMVEFPVLVVEEVELLVLFADAETVELPELEVVAAAVELTLLEVATVVEVAAAASSSSYLKSFKSLLPPELAPGSSNIGKSIPVMISFLVASS